MDLPTHPVDHNMVVVLVGDPQDNKEVRHPLVDMEVVKVAVVHIDKLVVDIVPLVVNVQVKHFVEALPAEEEKVVVV